MHSHHRTATPRVAKGVLLYTVALGLVAVATMALVGCGGGGSSSALGPVSPWRQSGATFVGGAGNGSGAGGRCQDCHASTMEQYKTQAHALNFADPAVHGSNFFDTAGAMKGRCASCHNTGQDQDGGWTWDGTTVPAPAVPAHLQGIGCESCHGPGSKHASSMKKEDITRVPDAQNTCIKCHLSNKFNGLNDTLAVSKDTLKTTAPDKVAVHHPQGQFLFGKGAYGKTQDTPSVHTTIPNTCVTCHLSPALDKDDPKVEDHSGAALTPDIGRIIGTNATCKSCHTAGDRGMLEYGVDEKLKAIGGVGANGEPSDDMSGGAMQAYAIKWNIKTTGNAAGAVTDPEDIHVQRYKAARHCYEFIHVDGSNGAHNPSLAYSLLRDIDGYLADTKNP